MHKILAKQEAEVEKKVLLQKERKSSKSFPSKFQFETQQLEIHARMMNFIFE